MWGHRGPLCFIIAWVRISILVAVAFAVIVVLVVVVFVPVVVSEAMDNHGEVRGDHVQGIQEYDNDDNHGLACALADALGQPVPCHDHTVGAN